MDARRRLELRGAAAAGCCLASGGGEDRCPITVRILDARPCEDWLHAVLGALARFKPEGVRVRAVCPECGCPKLCVNTITGGWMCHAHSGAGDLVGLCAAVSGRSNRIVVEEMAEALA